MSKKWSASELLELKQIYHLYPNKELALRYNCIWWDVAKQGHFYGLKKTYDYFKVAMKTRNKNGWLEKYRLARFKGRTPLRIFNCINCGIRKEVRPWLHKLKYCSKKCALEERNKNNNPMKNPESFEQMRKSLIALWKRDHNRMSSLCSNDFFKRKNPMNDPEVMKTFNEKVRISQKKYFAEHPEMLINNRLRRNRITQPEKTMFNILKSLGLEDDKQFIYNKMVKTNSGFKFPDFLIEPNLVIEVDGIYWHKPEMDKIRDKELNESGYKVVHFTDLELKNVDRVRDCIKNELSLLIKSE